MRRSGGRHALRGLATVAALSGVGALTAPPPAGAGPAVCDYPTCTPGIKSGVVLGVPCDDTTYYVFGTAEYAVSFATAPGRLMFCGSPRRYEALWFRSAPMAGVKEENSECSRYPQYYVAEAPDGLFLTCVAQNGHATWLRGAT